MPDVNSGKETLEATDEKPSPMPAAESETPVTTSQGGRRRGRRKVMKKKKVKDEEGFLGKSNVPFSCKNIWSDPSSHYRGTRMGVIFRR
jgi:DNA polymerase delta subunit 3